jgi:exopolysaccharide production protein ExoZ
MFASLQMGRAIAALAVCAFHLSLAFDDPRFGGTPLWLNVTRLGWHGVDFFFALSGFIIMYAHRGDIDRPDRLPRYAVKRALRIYPMYWLLTILAIVVALKSGRPQMLQGLDWVSVLGLVHVTSARTPLLPAWTLFHEVFFYAMFALLIWRRWLGVLAAAVWVALMLSFGSVPVAERSLWSTIVSPVNLCFFGGIAAYYLHGFLSAARSMQFAALGLALFVAVAIAGRQSMTVIGFSSFMSLAFCLLISGIVGLERNGKWRDVAWLSLLGNVSYTLYLAHIIVFAGLLKLAYVSGVAAAVGRPVLYLATLGLGTFVCVGLHIYIEKPLQQLCGDRLLRRKPAAPMLAS